MLQKKITHSNIETNAHTHTHTHTNSIQVSTTSLTDKYSTLYM